MNDSRENTATDVWLGRYARITSFATFLLIIVGSLVTTTDSGLAVPDWPLSFGQFFPPMVGGVLYEHGHRMVAGTVGLMTLALTIWVWISESRRWVRWLSLGALVAVVVQAILGGMTVLMKLPVAVSASHAGLAMAFFSTTVVLAMVTGRAWQSYPRPGEGTVSSRVVTMSAVVVITVYLQIILGAVMRHMGAGLAIPDFPLAYGQLIPPLHATSVAVHFAHRVGALLVGVVVLGLYMACRQSGAAGAGLERWIRLLVGLYAAQFLLGAWTIWSIKSLHVTTAHVATGALTLIVSVVIAVRAIRARSHRAAAPATRKAPAVRLQYEG